MELDEALIDVERMYQYRLGRVQGVLARRNIGALITYDPVNTRYATGMRNMQAWALHTVIRMGFIPVEGKAVLFEYSGSEHLAKGLTTVRSDLLFRCSLVHSWVYPNARTSSTVG